jgi:putative sigma-54 modulation protein
MALPNVRISGHGMEVTDAMKKYVEEKLNKYERVFDLATSIDVEFVENVAARGVDTDFKVEIMMALPRTVARVEKSGSDIYAIVDETTDVIYRKVKRYKEKLRQWEGSSPWKVEEGEIGDVSEDFDFITYIPKIVRRKKLEDCRPMSEAEAIERMEMLGYDTFLFKNMETGVYSLVYKRKRGGYGIVEPCEE